MEWAWQGDEGRSLYSWNGHGKAMRGGAYIAGVGMAW